MTMIAALKCSDGFVLCSDSQETVGGYRVSRQKLTPFYCGNFELAVAGSGNNGALIDSFAQRLQDNLGVASVQSLAELRSFIRKELLDFIKNEAAGYSRKDKDMHFIIGARSLVPPESDAWVTSASRLTPIDSYSMIGWEDYRYEDVLNRLYRPNIPIGQGIFLGLHLMSLAEQTSNFIKAPVTVVTIKDHEFRLIPQTQVDALQDRVKLFGSQFDALFLSCPDTGLQPPQFVERLKEFVDTVVHLRSEYTEETAQEMLTQGLDRINESFNLIPAGTTLVINPNIAQATELKRMHEEAAKAIREQGKGEQDVDRLMANLNGVKSYFVAHLSYIESPNSVPPPTDEVKTAALLATGDLMRAAMMGPYKISQAAVNVIGWIVDFVRSDPGLGMAGNFRVFIAALNGCLDVVKKESNPAAQSPPAEP